MICRVCNVNIIVVLVVIIMADLSTARSLPNRRRLTEREVIREANSDTPADKMSSKNPRVDEFIAELANLSIPHYLKDIYLNFTYSDGDIGTGKKVNTIRSYQNTGKSEF